MADVRCLPRVPHDDFTPHGLLWTPGHHAHAWDDPVGGVGATDPRRLGAGFRLLSPRRFVSLSVELALTDGRLLATRADYLAAGELRCPLHTSRQIAFEWRGAGVSLSLLVHSAGPQALGFELRVLGVGARARWRLTGPVPHDARVMVDDALLRDARFAARRTSRGWLALDGVSPVWSVHEIAREDARFWASAPQLRGDWPAAWRRGWAYDLETTRLIVQPPGGIYAGPWPSWAAEWPRTVAAEGSLDMARLAWADPSTALAALETLWTQALAPNLPCVFRDGEPNMLAADGRVCGTSPAWCLPLQAVEQAWLWTGDRHWLARVLPALESYVHWWARERVVAGYPSYACTWESGEDDNPRLDPHGTGGGAILGRNRPLELPATFAAGGAVLARLSGALGQIERREQWRRFAARWRRRLEAEYWDASVGRYRDLDPATGGFLEPTRAAYWQTDSVRQSPLGLLAALVTRDPVRRAALARELPAVDTPPWSCWPPWAGAILAAAEALGEHAFAAACASCSVERVWADLDAHEATNELTGRPLPGVAHEYWPAPLAGPRVHDGYGWGAETSAWLLRYVIGLRPLAAQGRARFELRPLLPPALAVPGRRYSVGPLTLRGWTFRLTLEPLTTGTRVVLASAGRGELVVSAPQRWFKRPLRTGGEASVDLAAGEAARIGFELNEASVARAR